MLDPQPFNTNPATQASDAPASVLLLLKFGDGTDALKDVYVNLSDSVLDWTIDESQGAPLGSVSFFVSFSDATTRYRTCADVSAVPGGGAIDPGKLVDTVVSSRFGGISGLLWFGDTRIYRANASALTPLYAFAGARAKFQFMAGGIRFDVDFICAVSTGGDPTAANCTPRAFIEQTSSEIFGTIADKYGWSQQKQDTTKRQSIAMFAGENHVQFLTRLAMGTMDKSGLPFKFELSSDSKTAYFVSSRFQKGNSVANQARVVRKYVYGADDAGEVIEFSPEDNSLIAMNDGGGETRMAGMDAKAGDVTTMGARPESGVDGRGAGPYVQGAEGTAPNTAVNPTVVASGTGGSNSATTQPTVSQLVNARDSGEANANASKIHAEKRHLVLTANMRVRGTHDVRVGDYIYGDYYIPAAGGINYHNHFMAGAYQVMKITHTGGGSPWTSQFSLLRQGMELTAAAGDVTNRQIKGDPMPPYNNTW